MYALGRHVRVGPAGGCPAAPLALAVPDGPRLSRDGVTIVVALTSDPRGLVGALRAGGTPDHRRLTVIAPRQPTGEIVDLSAVRRSLRLVILKALCTPGCMCGVSVVHW